MAKIQTNQEGWKLVGGRLCLDFLNTVGGRTGSATILRDKLVHYEDLLAWSEFAGGTTRTESRALARIATARGKEAESTLARAVQLREAMYRVFQSAVQGGRPRKEDLEIISRELRVARAHQRLTFQGGAFAWAWEGGEAALDRVLWPVARSAGDVLTSGDLSRLRQCDGLECGWMFLDTSRNRSRLWCDMKDCGNRAKVRRFRTRQQRSHRRARSW